MALFFQEERIHFPSLCKQGENYRQKLGRLEYILILKLWN